MSAAPATHPDSIKDLIAVMLAKVEGIKHKLQDLPAMREQLRDLLEMRLS